MNDATRRGHPTAGDHQAVTWSSLRGQVQLHLERKGMPAAQADRCSHEVIVACARELEDAGTARAHERAMAEAETRLVGWRAARGAGQLQAAA